jgi:hypothetical protein
MAALAWILSFEGAVVGLVLFLVLAFVLAMVMFVREPL